VCSPPPIEFSALTRGQTIESSTRGSVAAAAIDPKVIDLLSEPLFASFPEIRTKLDG
jgi:hypothetical protein